MNDKELVREAEHETCSSSTSRLPDAALAPPPLSRETETPNTPTPAPENAGSGRVPLSGRWKNFKRKCSSLLSISDKANGEAGSSTDSSGNSDAQMQDSKKSDARGPSSRQTQKNNETLLTGHAERASATAQDPAETSSSLPKGEDCTQKSGDAPDDEPTRDSAKNANDTKNSEKKDSRTFYEILGVSNTATQNEIRKAYYALAVKYHPDKNPDDPESETIFKQVAAAYKVLGDPVQRERYDTFGDVQEDYLESMPADFAKQFFRMHFGGGQFDDMIGDFAVAEIMQNAFDNAMNDQALEGPKAGLAVAQSFSKGSGIPVGGANGRGKTSVSQKKDGMELDIDMRQRVLHLAEKLVETTRPLTETKMSPVDIDAFSTSIRSKVKVLSNEPNGAAILRAVGHTYVLVAKSAAGGISGFFNSVREKGHLAGEVFSTVHSFVALQRTFANLEQRQSRAESETERAEIEGIAVQKTMEVIWKGCKLEIGMVLRMVCNVFLGQKNELETPAIPQDVAKKRLAALRLLGQLYQEAREPLDENLLPPK